MTPDGPRFEKEFELKSLEQSREFGRLLAQGIDSPGVIAFYGGLGSGKTTLIQAIGEGLGVEGPITSPTYTIVNSYEGGRLPLVHVDCYRLDSLTELEEIGLVEIFSGPQVVCVEWSERAVGLLPRQRLDFELRCLGPESRAARLVARGSLWPGIDSLLGRRLEGRGEP